MHCTKISNTLYTSLSYTQKIITEKERLSRKSEIKPAPAFSFFCINKLGCDRIGDASETYAAKIPYVIFIYGTIII